MNVLKSHLQVADKSIPARTVKTALALLVYLAKVKQRKQVQIALEAIPLKKVAMPLKVSLQASETQIPTHHVVLDVVSKKK